MGGKVASTSWRPSGSGENTLVTCENGDYAADIEVARGRAAAARAARAAGRARGGRDAGRDDDRGARRVPRHRPGGDLEGDAGVEARRHGRPRARPRRRPAERGEARRRRSAGPFRPATDDEIRAAFGAGGGSLGPVGVPGRGDRRRRAAQTASSSRARTATAGTCAASRPAATTSRASPTSASPARATRCPSCGGALRFQTAIEVGHIFKLRHALLGAARRDVPRRGRPREAARSWAATASARARHGGGRSSSTTTSTESSGRRAIAPYDAHVVALPGVEEQARVRAAEALSAAGARRAPRRPRPAGGREVRRRRPDRLPDPGHGRARRASRTGWSTSAIVQAARRDA